MYKGDVFFQNLWECRYSLRVTNFGMRINNQQMHCSEGGSGTKGVTDERTKAVSFKCITHCNHFPGIPYIEKVNITDLKRNITATYYNTHLE